jgi:hypothetical protein
VIKDATGSFAGALAPIAFLLMLATILPLITRKPGTGGRGRGPDRNAEMQPKALTLDPLCPKLA